MEKSKLTFVGKLMTVSDSHLDGCLLFNTVNRGRVLDIALDTNGEVLDIIPSKERKAIIEPCILMKTSKHDDSATKALKGLSFGGIQDKANRQHELADTYSDEEGMATFRAKQLLIKQLIND